MRGGHNIKSEKELKAKGTFQPAYHANRIESKVKATDSIPECPPNYGKKEKEFWIKTCEGLRTMGILQTIDVDQIELYVTNWFLWKTTSKDLMENGIMITVETEKGVRQIKNPAEVIMRNCERTLIALGDKFGFNPRARMGIKTDPQEEKDPFSAFLSN